MRAVVAYFDADGDGSLQRGGELSQLVREMAAGDGHVEHLVRRARGPALGQPSDEHGLLAEVDPLELLGVQASRRRGAAPASAGHPPACPIHATKSPLFLKEINKK